MRKFLSLVLSFCLFASLLLPVSAAVQPSAWAATDGLGRTLSANRQVGNLRQDRFVGMFYWIWHYPWTADTEPITTGSVLDTYPEAVNDWLHPAWNNAYDGRPFFWDEPLYGFYTNTDEYVLRKHAELLADADIDAIFFDATNATQVFPDGYEALLRVWSEAKEQGIDVPQIVFILNFGSGEETRTQLLDLYTNLYSTGRYDDMFFLWDGKPLIMADSSSLKLKNKTDRAVYNYFTFRDNESTYFADDFSRLKDTWGWCSEYPQTLFGKDRKGNVEQICVSVAQNANENGLNAMNCPEGTVQGRAFTEGYFSYSYVYGGEEITVDSNTENAFLYGLNFQQQWDYAIEHDPQLIFVTGFNEWIAGRFENWLGTENAFPDQFSPAYSRDIEPSAGVLKDHYYYQLVENVRRFKGADAIPGADEKTTIDIHGDVAQWDAITCTYDHYEGGKNRDSAGWKGCYYTNDTFRNDIVQAKIAYDSENVYFYVRTAEDLSPATDPDWMRLLIDTDTTGLSPNWEGFEYVLNRENPSAGKAILESADGLDFAEVCKVDYSISGNVLQVAIPRSALGFTDDEVKFNFKWSDNLQGTDALAFYQNGDCAPGGRFTFVFDSTVEKSETNPPAEETEPGLWQKICNKFKEFGIAARKFYNYLF